MILGGVEYRDWPRDKRFSVGSDGSVIGPLGYVLSPSLNKYGYAKITIGKCRTAMVATVVCETWHGMRPPGKEVAHENGIRTDNRPCNLKWKTSTENHADKIRHGTAQRGERHGLARLTDDAVRDIRASYAAGGVTLLELGERYGVSKSTVFGIVDRQTWTHVSPHPGGQFVYLRRTDREARQEIAS